MAWLAAALLVATWLGNSAIAAHVDVPSSSEESVNGAEDSAWLGFAGAIGSKLAHSLAAVSGDAVASGCLSRGIALVYCITFVSLQSQVLGLVGPQGIFPAQELLKHVAVRHSPTRLQRVHRLPTVLWLNGAGRRQLVWTVRLGVAVSALAVVGVDAVPSSLLLSTAVVLFLSLCSVAGEFLCFPWDRLLTEAGFLAMWLPPVVPCLQPMAWLSTSSAAWSSASSKVTNAGLVAICAMLVAGVTRRLRRTRVLGLAAVGASLYALFSACAAHVVAAATTSVHAAGAADNGWMAWIRAECAPNPVVWIAVRFLLFRVMFGMGKLKFDVGWWHGHAKDYLYRFLVWQPLPTPLAWRLFHLPLMRTLAPAALVALFITEIIMPWALFLPWRLPTVLFAVACLALQVGISAVGNYGTFNVLTAALTVPLLLPFSPSAAPVEELPSAGIAALPAAVAVAAQVAAALLSLFGGVAYLPHCSWCSASWLCETSGHARCPFQRPPAQPSYYSWLPWGRDGVPRDVRAALRWLAPFRIVHAYGVFDSNKVSVGVRAGLAVTGSQDLVTWTELPFRHFATGRGPSSTFSWFAPHQPRIDHQAFYASVGAHLGSIDRTNPCYSHNGAVWLENLMLQLMRGSKDVQQLMQWSSVGVPFDGDDAPEFMRAPQFLLKVSSRKEFASRGVRCFRLALPRTWVVPLMTRSDQVQRNSSSNLFACEGL